VKKGMSKMARSLRVEMKTPDYETPFFTVRRALSGAIASHWLIDTNLLSDCNEYAMCWLLSHHNAVVQGTAATPTVLVALYS
jgi:hypothetical protein